MCAHTHTHTHNVHVLDPPHHPIIISALARKTWLSEFYCISLKLNLFPWTHHCSHYWVPGSNIIITLAYSTAISIFFFWSLLIMYTWCAFCLPSISCIFQGVSSSSRSFLEDGNGWSSEERAPTSIIWESSVASLINKWCHEVWPWCK